MRQVVKLTGITKKGRERVKQHGSLWEVVEGAKSPCFPDSLLLVTPTDWRWVRRTGDENFLVEETEHPVR